jgi:hypothetical protein
VGRAIIELDVQMLHLNGQFQGIVILIGKPLLKVATATIRLEPVAWVDTMPFGWTLAVPSSWLAHDGPGPFDGPESLAPSERCLISFAATVPTIPSLYNNYKRIIQTETHIIILHEMVHDARIIRIDSEHLPLTEGQGQWLGDSVGHWEGDVLVVEATHFRSVNGLPGADENLHVVERFSRLEDGNLHYDFTVTDETVWSAPWSGRYTWASKPESKLYEYACHETNYSMVNILKGARLLKIEWREQRASIGAEKNPAVTNQGRAMPP